MRVFFTCAVVADALDAELVEVGAVDRHRLRSLDVLPRAVDEIDRRQAAVLGVGADDDDARRAAFGLAPLGEAHDQRDHRFDARRRQRLMPLARRQQHAAVLEALGAEHGDPQIGFGGIDVGSDHVAGAEVEAELHGNEHDGKQNADQRDRETDAVMKQITKGKRQDH